MKGIWIWQRGLFNSFYWRLVAAVAGEYAGGIKQHFKDLGYEVFVTESLSVKPDEVVAAGNQ